MTPSSHVLHALVIAIAFAVAVAVAAAPGDVEYQSYDGTGNNKEHPEWGSINSPLVNRMGVQYADSNQTEPFPLEVPANDTVLGQQILRFNRTDFDSVDTTTGARIYRNKVTPWIDGSMIYGTTAEDAASFRAGKDGLLKTVATPVGDMPPRVPADGNFVFPKSNGNIFPHIISLQILLMREHNRKAREIRKLDANLSDEEVFQKARRWVIALIQKVTFEQYLPSLLGAPLPPYPGYNASVQPVVEAFFPVVAMRYGHAAVTPFLQRYDASNEPSEVGPLVTSRCLYLNGVRAVGNDGIEGIIRGMTIGKEKRIDLGTVSELRSLTMNNQKIDVTAFDIMRGRDWGIPNYNRCRRFYGLANISSFDELTTDKVVVAKLKSLYRSINDLDAIVGALAEDHSDASSVGPLLTASLRDYYLTLRTADRFWYENPSTLTAEERAELGRMTLGEMIKLHMDVSPDYPSNPFRIAAGSKGSKANVVQSNDGAVRVSWTVKGQLVEFVVEANSTNGWFAFGIGSDTMQQADVFFVTKDENNGDKLTVYDAWSTRTAVLDRDTNRGCKSDITDIKDISGTLPTSKRAVTFARLLVTRDSTSCDVSIRPGKTLDMIMAYNPNTFDWVHHGPSNHFALKGINFFAEGTSFSASKGEASVENLKGWHGASMFAAFGVMYPVGIFVARYHLDMKNWVDIHASMMGMMTSNILITAVTAVVGEFGTTDFIHVRIAYAVVALVILTTACGIVNAKLHHRLLAPYKKHFRLIHRVCGYSVYLLGLLGGWFGVNDLMPQYPNLPWLRWAYVTSILAVPATLILYGEMQARMAKPVKPVQEKRESRISRAMNGFGELLGDKKPEEKLPCFTWEEIGVRIAEGAKWIVIDKRIYDVAKFMHLHPGGPEILKNHLGFDCTTIFFGRTIERSGEVTIDRFPTISTVTSWVTNRSPAHAHSRYAQHLLQEMAIGKLKAADKTASAASIATYAELDEASASSTTADPSSTSTIPRHLLGILPDRFQTLTLTDRELCTRPGSYRPVYRFRFKFDRPDKIFMVRPGQAVLLRGVNKHGDVITRPYTPVRCENVGGLEFFIKIYGGEMTKFLLGTDTVQVMGPSPGSDALNRRMTGKGCWKTLGMVAGGTGLTAMILLIDHHIRNAPRTADGKPDLDMTLLFCVNSPADLFARDRLEDLITQSQGTLTVRYIISTTGTTGNGGGIASHFSSRGGNVPLEVADELAVEDPSAPASPISPRTDEERRAVLERCVFGRITADKLALCLPLPPQPSKERKRSSKWLTASNHESAGVSTVLNGARSGEETAPATSSEEKCTTTCDEDQKDPNDMAIIVCGPPTMNLAVQNMLRSLKYPSETVIML
ncbi:hypothetical protein HDU96_003149 [Phlyctochytrium bullatum]|nr:hypothetical protein HDU96_003149 [Phlyctochytrium bullatum]